MSNFAVFMAGAAAKKETVKYAASKRFVEKGKPVEWEIRPIDSDLDEMLRKECTKKVPVPGKRGQFCFISAQEVTSCAITPGNA